MPSQRKPLNERQRAALDEYFNNNFNKTKALEAAGYRHAGVYCVNFFANPHVEAEVNRRMALREKKQELSKDWIVQRLMRIATTHEVLAKFKKVQDDGSLAWDFSDATQEELQLVGNLSTEIVALGRGKNKQWVKKFKIEVESAKSALDSLARIEGLFKDNVTVNGQLSLVERLQKGRERAAAAKKV